MKTARRFDLIIYTLQVAILRGARYASKCSKTIRRIASILEKKEFIPMVAAQMELLLELQTDDCGKMSLFPCWKA